MNIPAIFDDEMKEIVESFIVETKELLEKLDNDLVELEKRPEDLEILNAIFRYVHTIKGTSSFIGFEQMSELAHRFDKFKSIKIWHVYIRDYKINKSSP